MTMRRRRAVALALALTLALVAGCTSDEARPAANSSVTASSAEPAFGPSAGCTSPQAITLGTSERHVISGGMDRVYELRVPASYDGTKPFPMLLALHALTESYTFVFPVSGLADATASRDIIGVAPSGLASDGTPFWNAAPVTDNYDVQFISDLLDDLEATLCIDAGRVFATGMSNGAQMSSLLACRMPQRITAIAPIAGVEFPPPCDEQPVPIIAFHGTADPIVPYRGGGLSATKIADTEFYKGNIPPGLPAPVGVEESMRLWAEHNHCDPHFTDIAVAPHVRRRTWIHCAAPTELYIIDGGGHSWPGKPVPQFEAQFGPGTTEIDATSLLLTFFLNR